MPTLSGFPDDQSLADLMAQFAVRASVTAIEGTKIEWSRGYGVKSAGGEAVTPKTVFQACSISKAVTAVGVARLAQEGVLDLDEDVNSFSSLGVPLVAAGRRQVVADLLDARQRDPDLRDVHVVRKLRHRRGIGKGRGPNRVAGGGVDCMAGW